VGEQTALRIILSENTLGLEEVVVVGYGTVRKSDLTGAVSSITSEQIRERSNVNVMSSLSGQLAGVQVQQTQGSPGFAPTIKIRGISTITAGTTPLYVIDGLPMEDVNLSIINAQDIESIEILKDASSAAIYGSRGANGVVLITTKSGKEGKPKVDFSYEKGIYHISRRVELMNSQEFIRYFVDAHNNQWIYAGGKAEDPNNIRPQYYRVPQEFLDAPGKFATTDWQDVTFRTAGSDNYQISLSGGGNTSKYLLSANYISQEGVVDRTQYERFTLRSNVSYKINHAVEAGVNIFFSKTQDRIYGTQGKEDVVSLAIQNDPIFPLYNENGNLGFRDPNSEWYRFTPYEVQLWHPYALTRETENYGRQLNLMASAWIEYRFLKNFSFRSAVSGYFIYNKSGSYRNEGQKWGYSNWRPAEATANTSQNDNYLWENILSYNNTIADHAINIMGGYTAQKNHNETTTQTSQGFPNDLVHTLNAGTPVASGSQATEWSLISYIARINYSFRDKYLLTATIRRDGSSRFGLDNKWGYFPSASVAWKITEEEWMKGLSWLTSLKIRASYGQTGNNLIPNYGAIAMLGSRQYAWGTNVQRGLYPSSISNPALKWEKTGQFDLGLNAGLFNNRIYIEADIYHSRTTDLLLNVPVPALTGFVDQLTNIGTVQNRGAEFLVSTRNLVKAFVWNTSFNISLNRNKVISLGPNNAPVIVTNWNATSKTEVGEPVGNFFGYIFDGVFKNQKEIDAYPHVPSTTAGDPRIRDVNNDGLINENDRTTIGNAQPKFTFGLTNNFSFKNFDFSILLTGSYGNSVTNLQSRYTKYYNGGRNGYKDIVNYFRSEADPGDGIHFKPYKSYPGLQTQYSSYWVEDGSFIKISNIRLGYSFSPRILSPARISSLRLYMNIDNAWCFSNYLGYDPENSTYSDALNSGNDYGAHPIPRTFTFGINLGF
jgi:TonB-linked SusC/RagA family outer membrane protein